MRHVAQAVLVTHLAHQLREKGSWCGETHLQKALYLLQELEGVPLEFEFILYKHGPFSFDLRDKLTELRADGFLELKPRPYPYGPTFAPSEQALETWKSFPVTLRNYADELNRVADLVGDSGVSELEQIATALYVTRELGDDASREERAARMVELKPHVSEEDALNAVAKIDEALQNRKH